VTVLGFVPARGGSTRLKRKNAAPLAGKPLLSWTLDAARQSGIFDALVVSSDDDAMLELAHRDGVRTLRREAALASGDVSVAQVIVETLGALEAAGERYDAVYALLPTSPFRSAATIVRAWTEFLTANAGALISVAPQEHPPEWSFDLHGGRLVARDPQGFVTPRARLVPAYRADGAHLIARVDYLRRHGDFVGPDTLGFLAPEDERIDIDTPHDLAFAEFLARGVGA
jgi:CMP-N,N'-diacetyllegionaminic acid synthase